MAGVVGMTRYQPPEVKEQLLNEYPKLRTSKPQSDIHSESQLVGSRQLFAWHDPRAGRRLQRQRPTPSRPHGRWSWNRGYGCLYLLDNDRTDHDRRLGADYEGYSWSKAPGITMPAVTDEEYIKHHTVDGEPKSEHGVELNTTGGAGNGSVTFQRDRRERLARVATFSFQTRKSENLRDLEGPLSESTEWRARRATTSTKTRSSVWVATTRRTQTERWRRSSFQETLDEILWKGKNPGRWNPKGADPSSSTASRFADDVQRELCHWRSPTISFPPTAMPGSFPAANRAS